MNDETGDELKHEDVSEVDGVGPVADVGEEAEIADDAGAFELDGAEEEESGEGAVEEGAAPGPSAIHSGCRGWRCALQAMIAVSQRSEQMRRCRRGMKATATVDVEEDTAGEKLSTEGLVRSWMRSWRAILISISPSDGSEGHAVGDRPEGSERRIGAGWRARQAEGSKEMILPR